MKQGCGLAPVLFDLFVSAVLYVVHEAHSDEENGIPVRYRYDGGGLFNLERLKSETKCKSGMVNELQYGDDAAFVSNTTADLQRVVSSLRSAYNRAELSMNLTKMQVLAQQTGSSQQLADPQIYHHLQLSLDEEVLRRILLASSAFGRLTHREFLNHRLSLIMKKSVYRADGLNNVDRWVDNGLIVFY